MTERYEPIPVATLLKRMQNIVSLVIDLAYASVIYESHKVRKEVYRLEEEIDTLATKLEIQTMLATRDYEDALEYASFLKIGYALRMIANASADIAELHISIEGQPVPIIFRAIMNLSDQNIERIEIDNTGWIGLIDHAVHDLEELFGIDVMVIIRKSEYLIGINLSEMRLEIDDRVICRGSKTALNVLSKASKGELKSQEEITNDLESTQESESVTIDLNPQEQHLVQSISYLKKKSELALDLAFSSLLLNDSRLADEVIRLETELDHLDRNLGNIALNIHAKSLEDQDTVLNIIRLSKALEEISDAAALIISPIRSETGIPHILRDVVQKTEEKISIHEVAEDSEAIGSTVIEFENQVHGMWIVAIYREARGYIIDPPESFKIIPKDTLIFKAYGKTKRRLRLYEEGEDLKIGDST
ncbi:MAG: potassium channel family protein [Candidatus Hodarchaeales archaeon]